MSITINIYYKGKNGAARKFAEEMESSGTADLIRAEAGNICYRYFQPLDDPETVLLIDSWESQAAIDAHHASPMMGEIIRLREKYDLHMRAERYISDEDGIPARDRAFIREASDKITPAAAVDWADPSGKCAEDPDGEFESAVFRGEDGAALGIYLMDGASREYGEKCVSSLSSLPQKTVIEICKGLIKCAEEGGEDVDFKLPRLGNAKDVLQYCWFTEVYAIKPDRGFVSYIVSGEGEWCETVAFAVEDGRVAFVGADFNDYLDAEE